MTKMKRQLAADYFFLFAYWLTFVLLAVLLSRHGGAGFRIAAFAATCLATTTALLDVVENLRTRGLLALTGPHDQIRRQPVVHLKATSRLKWLASSLTVALLSLLFLAGSGKSVAIGIALLGMAAVGVVGARWSRLIQAYMLLFFVVGIVIGAWFAVSPANALSHL